jgi:cytoplasmic iron level regulating protein YaaA (DUF328/UPF0246 family)
MLFLLSPAKSLDFETPVREELTFTQPIFNKQAADLIKILRLRSSVEIGHLMSLSDKLSALNVARYGAWRVKASKVNAKQAILAFNGDVYEGLDAASLPDQALLWAQEHVAVLSGLYGVLRPLDLLQPYRLEMGTQLENPLGKNLYHYWQNRIATHLNTYQKNTKEAVVVNLASQEYFKAVDTSQLNARLVECVFQEQRAGTYKIISFMAKRARGLMARFAIEHRVNRTEDLKSFTAEGYAYCKAESTDARFVFRRGAL